MHLLKMRKLRSKYKKVLRKIVPISSVLYSIATSYKQWKLKYVHRQDSFYSYYFMTTHNAIVTHNLSKENILLSGDIELNPGPNIDNTTIGFSFSNLILYCTIEC